MQKTFDEILADNDRLNDELRTITATRTGDALSARLSDSVWSVSEILEHIAIVENSSIRVCTRLLKKAQSAETVSPIGIRLSENYLSKGSELSHMKVEAPEIVRPTGTRTIEESLDLINTNKNVLEQLGPLFEAYSVSDFTFPHPYLGNLTAAEWLDLIPAHKKRHLRQIYNQITEK